MYEIQKFAFMKILNYTYNEKFLKGGICHEKGFISGSISSVYGSV